jgi:hypothetical protein
MQVAKKNLPLLRKGNGRFVGIGHCLWREGWWGERRIIELGRSDQPQYDNDGEKGQREVSGDLHGFL